MLVNQLEYKGLDAGLQVIRETEEYTSKCSFLDLEIIGKHKKYKGKRIYQHRNQTNKMGTSSLLALIQWYNLLQNLYKLRSMKV